MRDPARHDHGVFLAAGRGTRFWPASRHDTAKQFLPVAGTEPLLRRTWNRLDGIVPPERRWVVTGADQVEAARACLPELSAANLLAEPVGRNTAACAAWSALAVRRRAPDAVLALLPSDHVIEPAEAFRAALAAAFDEAHASNALVTLGIRPTRPATGYGYIELGERIAAGTDGRECHAVSRFVEKPDAARAREFLASARFLWNAGIFVWRPDAILQAFERYAPDILGPLVEAGDDAGIARIFAELPARSVDVAILERAKNVRVMPFAGRWNDVGSWAALPEVIAADEAGNWRSGGARSIAVDATRCVVHAPADELVALLGVGDLIVVRAGDATLICARDRAEQVRAIVERLGVEAPEFL